jgi:transcriptional regulator of acetoin/glycerol metabolism
MIKSLATLAEARDSAERRQIMRALHETKGQILEAAALLGISRTTLWDKMRRLNVQAHEK